MSPAEILEIRAKWKPLFEKHVWETYKNKLRRDVIVRDMKRMDSYPHPDENDKRISPWFRIGLVGTYHRGIVMFHSWGMLTKDGDRWRYTNYKAGERGDAKVCLISHIPYESIVSVDWDGDEYYNYPHIYCHFNYKKEPYEWKAICTETVPQFGSPFYTEFADLKDVQRRSKKLGLLYFG